MFFGILKLTPEGALKKPRKTLQKKSTIGSADERNARRHISNWLLFSSTIHHIL